MIRLRPYQERAVKIALERKRCVVVLPTGTGKTVIGFFFLRRLFDEGKIKSALILVPTRILVEQTKGVYDSLGLRSKAIYGIMPKDVRVRLWRRAKVAISTPETVYSDLEFVKADAVVVDECHHAVGDDAYVKVLKELRCDYRLGLSAFIPRRRRREISELIGDIVEWSIDEVRPYIAEWIGDVFETPFDRKEREVYEEIERRRARVRGRDKLVYTSALKFLSRDGALALKESLKKKNRMSELLSDLKGNVMSLRDLHKLDKLRRALEIYEDFEKCIVFVERVIVANRLSESLSGNHEVATILGKKWRKKGQLERAKKAEVIISTSAGEEGVDLPTADLLINWSNTSSPLRFIQRHGRIMRKAGRIPKFVVYLVTPDTLDTDALITSVDEARDLIDVNVDKNVLERLWRRSNRYKIVRELERPMPAEWLRDLTGCTLNELRYALRRALRSGEIVYVYTHLGKIFVRRDRIRELERYVSEPIHRGKVKLGRRTIMGDYGKLMDVLKKRLPLPKLEITVIRRVGELDEYDYMTYDFPIDSEEVLDLVLRNALSYVPLRP